MRTSEYLAQATLATQTTNIANLSLRDLLDIRFPLVDVRDQRRTVKRLSAGIYVAKMARNASAARLDRAGHLRVNVLRDAIALPLAGPWPWVRLDAVAEFLDSRRRPITAVERAARTREVPSRDLVPYYGANGRAGWIDTHLFDEPLVLLAEDGVLFGSTRGRSHIASTAKRG